MEAGKVEGQDNKETEKMGGNVGMRKMVIEDKQGKMRTG